MYFILGLVLIDCGKPNPAAQNQSVNSDTLNRLSLLQLQGAWWSESNQQSALFLIADDSLYFTDEQQSPYFLRVTNNKIFLERDSLTKILYVEDLTADTLSLYDSSLHEKLRVFKKPPLSP